MFTDITIAQRSNDYTNVSDLSAKLISLSIDGDAVLMIGSGTAEFIVQQLSQKDSKPILISTGSVMFKAGNYEDSRLQCSLVRIVE